MPVLGHVDGEVRGHQVLAEGQLLEPVGGEVFVERRNQLVMGQIALQPGTSSTPGISAKPGITLFISLVCLRW